MGFFVIYGKHNGTKCDDDMKEFKTLKDANKYASMLWGLYLRIFKINLIFTS